jgi:hypothetical protein
MGAHKRIRLFRRKAFLHRILDARPELFLHPVAGYEHFDAGQPKVSFLEVRRRIPPLQGTNRVETEVGKEPRAGDEHLGLPARVVWHGATIRRRTVMLLTCRC